MTYRDDLTRATLKVYERYAVEVVEQFGFCPWARAARESQSAPVRVVFSANLDDFEESLTQICRLCHEPPQTDIALLVYPLLDVDRLGFEDFVRRLRLLAEADARTLTAFAMAAFHPHAAADLSHPDRLVPFVRRSPDPTLQLVRNSALSGIKGLSAGTAFLDISALSIGALVSLAEPQPKPVRERIAEQNLTTVRDVGPEAVEHTLHDIFRERERAHAELARRYGERGPERFDPG